MAFVHVHSTLSRLVHSFLFRFEAACAALTSDQNFSSIHSMIFVSPFPLPFSIIYLLILKLSRLRRPFLYICIHLLILIYAVFVYFSCLSVCLVGWLAGWLSFHWLLFILFHCPSCCIKFLNSSDTDATTDEIIIHQRHLHHSDVSDTYAEWKRHTIHNAIRSQTELHLTNKFMIIPKFVLFLVQKWETRWDVLYQNSKHKN